ncbi:hypothetical protein J6590_038579 [Homalodisca vitripennis]|nr:hypothetical protein J6590_038579 [Homalodisca vitripennis]
MSLLQRSVDSSTSSPATADRLLLVTLNIYNAGSVVSQDRTVHPHDGKQIVVFYKLSIGMSLLQRSVDFSTSSSATADRLLLVTLNIFNTGSVVSQDRTVYPHDGKQIVVFHKLSIGMSLLQRSVDSSTSSPATADRLLLVLATVLSLKNPDILGAEYRQWRVVLLRPYLVSSPGIRCGRPIRTTRG